MSVQKLAATVKSTPLTETLPKLFGALKKRRRSQKAAPSREENTDRVDIISEQLCDDVIAYLAPTLEQHKGCTIVDFDPGACLFSTRLHNLLKPKKHILLEPDVRYHGPFIKPLLAQENSKYHLTVLPNTARQIYSWTHETRNAWDPTLLSDRPPLDLDDLKALQYDPSVLILGNLARRIGPVRAGGVQQGVEYQRGVLYQLSRMALARSGIFEHGLLRSLWWTTDSVKLRLIAENMPTNRATLGTDVEMAFEVSEVAGIKPVWNRWKQEKARKRLGGLDRMADNAVQNRMDKAGMKIPEGRKLQESRPPHMETRTTPIKDLSPFTNVRNTVTDLDNDITVVSDRLAEVAEWAATPRIAITRHDHLIEHTLKTIQYPQAATISKANTGRRDINAGSPHTGARKTAFLDIGLRILNLEASYQNIRQVSWSPKLERLKTRILDLDKRYSKAMLAAAELVHHDCLELLSDQLAAYSIPPLLTHDNRQYNPLAASDFEFYPPKNGLALLDLRPRSLDLSVPGLASPQEGAKVASQLFRGLLRVRNSSISSALESIAVNAGKDLIPQVEAITDVRKGGRLDPERVSAKMVTREMVAGLVRAWFEWPFRPEGWMVELDHSGGDGKGEDVEGGKEEGRKRRES